MQDPIQPLHRLPFTELSGFAANPLAPTAYVRSSRELINPLLPALEYWAWSLTSLAAILIAFLLWRVLRIRARPQRRGLPHCRACHYELSEGAGACPECGRAISPRGFVRGRSTRRRLAPLALPGVLLLAILAAAIALAAGWSPTLPFWASPTAQRLCDRLGVTVPKRFLVWCSTIVEVDLASGATLRTVVGRRSWVSEMSVAPTGDSMLVTGLLAEHVVRLSTIDGRELARLRPYAAPPGLQYSERLTGWAPDGNSAYVAIPAETPGLSRIARWSFADDSLKIVAEIPTYASKQPGSILTRSAQVVPGPSERILAYSGGAETFDNTNFIVAMHSSQEPRPHADFGLDIEPGAVVAISPDGSRFYLSGQSNGGAGKLIAVETRSLTILETVDMPAEITGPIVALDATGRLIAAGGYDAVAIRDTARGVWIASLTIPQDLAPVYRLQFSVDGRFLIANATWFSPSGPPRTFHDEILVWDLAPLRGKLVAPAPEPSADTPQR